MGCWHLGYGQRCVWQFGCAQHVQQGRTGREQEGKSGAAAAEGVPVVCEPQGALTQVEVPGRRQDCVVALAGDGLQGRTAGRERRERKGERTVGEDGQLPGRPLQLGEAWPSLAHACPPLPDSPCFPDCAPQTELTWSSAFHAASPSARAERSVQVHAMPCEPCCRCCSRPCSCAGRPSICSRRSAAVPPAAPSPQPAASVPAGGSLLPAAPAASAAMRCCLAACASSLHHFHTCTRVPAGRSTPRSKASCHTMGALPAAEARRIICRGRGHDSEAAGGGGCAQERPSSLQGSSQQQGGTNAVP